MSINVTYFIRNNFSLNYFYCYEIETQNISVIKIVLCFRLPNGGAGQTVWEERVTDHREEHNKRNKHEITDLADVMHNLRPCKLFVLCHVSGICTGHVNVFC